MKVLPFKIPKPQNESLIYQRDEEDFFYNKLHQHEEIQISWIVQGEGTLVVGDSVSEYGPGDFLVIGSNLPHVFKSDKSEHLPSIMLSLFFSKNAYGKDFFLRREFDELTDFFDASEKGFQVLQEINPLKKFFLALEKSSKVERFILFFQILKRINSADKKLLSSHSFTKNLSDNEGKRMSDVMDFLMNSFSEPITLKEISEIANMTPNAFCRYFKHRTNKTYVQFLTEIRIEYASKLLRKNKDKSVAEIATESGFKNISNFNRKFKSLKKTTPVLFRNA